MQTIRTDSDVLDLFAWSVQRALDARREAVAMLETIDSYAHHFENASANGDRDSQMFLGRLNVLRAQLEATGGVAILDAAKAAARLGLLGPDGSPRDSAYATIKKAGGVKVAGKWMIAEDQLDAYLRKGRR